MTGSNESGKGLQPFAGRVAVIAGGSGGLGAPVSAYLASQGASVGILYHQHRDRADELVSEVRRQGGNAISWEVDITSRKSVDSALAAVVDAFGTVDFFVNCAGVSRNGMVWKMSDDDWTETVETNLSGAFQCTRAAVTLMRSRGFGRIVNITSIVGQTGIAGTSAYAASKAGIEGLTRTAAVEAAARGVTVNALALGYFDAGIISQVPKPMVDDILARVPTGRLGSPRELCAAIAYLCSDEAAYTTGQTISINGGLHLS